MCILARVGRASSLHCSTRGILTRKQSIEIENDSAHGAVLSPPGEAVFLPRYPYYDRS